jgi:hypothetical protein
MRSTSARPLPADVLARLGIEFGKQAGRARSLLSNIRGHLQERARSLRCIVFLADGDVRPLPLLIDQAISDYRDVIFWAEYTDWEATDPKRVRDLSRPFGKSTAGLLRGQPDGQRLPPDVRRWFEARIAKGARAASPGRTTKLPARPGEAGRAHRLRHP